MKYFSFLMLICCFLFSPFKLSAESFMKPQPLPLASELVPVPEDMRQLWVVRSCDKGKLAYRFSEHFLLTSVSVGSKLSRIGGFLDNGGDRYSMVTPAETVGFVMGTQGDLILYYGDPKTSFPLEAVEKKQLLVPHILLKNCTAQAAPAIKEDAVLISLLPKLDNVHKACPEKTDIYKTACQEAIFMLFDSDQDSVLNEDDMQKAWNIILSYSTFSTCGPLADKNHQLRADGKPYFTWLFENLDKNTDQKISFDEMKGTWSLMQGDPLMSAATNLLIAAEGPLALLPDSVRMDCQNCCIALGAAAP